MAERAGLISVIDNSLLFRCVQLVRKTQRRNLNRGFFCNISPHTLRDSSFFPEFIEFMNHNARLAASLMDRIPIRTGSKLMAFPVGLAATTLVSAAFPTLVAMGVMNAAIATVLALLAFTGTFLYEQAYIRAGQLPPLS